MTSTCATAVPTLRWRRRDRHPLQARDRVRLAVAEVAHARDVRGRPRFCDPIPARALRRAKWGALCEERARPSCFNAGGRPPRRPLPPEGRSCAPARRCAPRSRSSSKPRSACCTRSSVYRRSASGGPRRPCRTAGANVACQLSSRLDDKAFGCLAGARISDAGMQQSAACAADCPLLVAFIVLFWSVEQPASDGAGYGFAVPQPGVRYVELDVAQDQAAHGGDEEPPPARYDRS